MSSGGPKMVEMSYGVAESGQKIMNFLVVHGGRRHRFAGPIPECPATVRREIPSEGSSGCCTPPRPARVTGGLPVLPHLVRSLTARK